jgi:triacylglycerol lipase
MREELEQSVVASGRGLESTGQQISLRIDPPIASSNWVLVRGRVEVPRPKPRLGWLFSRRSALPHPELIGASLAVGLPGEDEPRGLAIGADGSFEARLAASLPRLRSARRQLRFTLRRGGELVEQFATLFTPRPGAAVGVIVLSATSGDLCLSPCSHELISLISGGGPAESNPVFYVGLACNGKPQGTAAPTTDCHGGLAISLNGQTAPAAIAVEQASWIVRLTDLFADELEFVVATDTTPQSIATLRALTRLGVRADRLRAIFVSDTRPVARGVMLQVEQPSGIDGLELPIVIVRTLDEARRVAATCGVKPISCPSILREHAARRISATHNRVTRYPLVFCHGMLGYSVLRMRRINLETYFNGLRELLIDRGFRVLMPELGRTHSIEQRAEQLRRAIGRWTAEPVNIVAHSMGGLDARFLISKLGMADRVASLTTIATPHHGSYFADWFVDGFDAKVPFLRSLERLGLEVDGFHDCTRAACRVFNQSVPNSPNVRYSSYSAFQVARKIPPVLRRSHSLIARAEGANDGLVSELSARWGEHLATLRADHLSLVGERGPEYFDHLAFYSRIVDDLIRHGF